MINLSSYNKDILEEIIENCCDSLFLEQPMLFQEESDVNERTVSGELKTKLEKHLSEFHVNCEYNRMTDENSRQIPKRINLDPNVKDLSRVFPDIIIHRQEDGKHNLLIIELKMSWKNSRKKEDFKKLERYLTELKYKFGLYLELCPTGISEMIWFA